MSMMTKSLVAVWDSLRSRKAQQSDFLDEVRLNNLRGIRGLRVPFDYPVSVLAGPNGCGKSTVLFACAAAYKPKDQGVRAFTPATLFPGFTDTRDGVRSDMRGETSLEFYYLAGGKRYAMEWKRRKTWGKNFMGRKGVRQPERTLYLRTLTNLTNPSEVRGILQLSRRQFEAEEITAEQLLFAHRILPQRYRDVSLIRAKNRDLLFAGLEGHQAVKYSEFHMSAGERAILRISKDISHLKGALILIDEVEAGLHPYTQQQIMLELQRIALRNDLQIIVTSHSPVVLDSVPPEARLFFQRDAQTLDVVRLPAYRDIFQKALYGQSTDRLSILCEDEVAEGVILGALDVLNHKIGTRHDDFSIGRDTGSDEFKAHIHTLGKIKALADFVFVLDGDARAHAPALQSIATQYGHSIEPIFLPGISSPENWLWETIQRDSETYASEFGLPANALDQRLSAIEQTFSGDPTVRSQDIPKAKLAILADELNRSAPEVARIVGKLETEQNGKTISEFRIGLEEQINSWRQLGTR